MPLGCGIGVPDKFSVKPVERVLAKLSGYDLDAVGLRVENDPMAV